MGAGTQVFRGIGRLFGGRNASVSTADQWQAWECFDVEDGPWCNGLKTHHGSYISITDKGHVTTKDQWKAWECLVIEQQADGRVAIKSKEFGYYVTAKEDG